MPGSTQMNFRRMIGRVLEYNPDAPPGLVKGWIQDAYRRVVDARTWSGLLVRGQVSVPNVYSTGSVVVTSGSQTVTGTGTAFTASMVGATFRIGFSYPSYRIVSVDEVAQTLLLDLPWGEASLANQSFQIFVNFVTLGYNVKRVLAMVNQKQGKRLILGMPQEVINARDAWRTQAGWTTMLIGMAPTADGQPQYELWPAPTFQQSFPFLAFVQPPDLDKDDSFPAMFIRADVIISYAIADALLFAGKNRKYYDPQAAAFHQQRADRELMKMAQMDDSNYLQDLIWEFDKYPLAQYGADWAQCHDAE
jgi:hypothetical protein